MAGSRSGVFSLFDTAVLGWLLLFPSLGVVQKYVGSDGALAFFAAGAGSLLVIRPGRSVPHALRRLGRRGTLGLLVVVSIGLAAAFLALYPVAAEGQASWLSPSGTLGGGSDRDDALNVAIEALLGGRYPYDATTQLGNQPSQLPGSLLLALPFALAGNAAWQNVFWFAALPWVLRSAVRDSRVALVAVLLASASPVVLQDFVTGGDLGTGAVIVLASCLWLERSTQGRPGSMGRESWAVGGGWWHITAAAAFLGIAITTRTLYALLMPLILVRVWSRSGSRAAATVLAAVAVVAGVLILPFYAYDPSRFAPFWLQNKFGLYAPWLPAHAPVVFPGIAVLLAIAAAAVFGRGPLDRWLVGAGLLLTAPAAMFMGLVVQSGSWDLSWTGYALPGVFFGVVGVALRLCPTLEANAGESAR